MKTPQYKEKEEVIDEYIRIFIEQHESNEYYGVLLKSKFDEYSEKRNITALKACLKENNVYGVLSAYRLFYVGCSRARKNLAIVVQNSDVGGFKAQLINKLRSIGFDIKDRATEGEQNE